MTQLFPNPRVRECRVTGCTFSGNDLKSLRLIAALALFVTLPAFAQDAPPTPAPMPMFHAPVATGDDVAPADQQAPPTDATAPSADDTAVPAPGTATDAIAAVDGVWESLLAQALEGKA